MLHHSLSAFARAQASSIAAVVADYAVLFGLVELLNIWYVPAVAAGALAGALTNFCLNRSWSFAASEGAWRVQASRYFVVAVGSLVLNTLGVWLGTDFIGLHYAASVVIVSVAVGLFFNYPLQRHFVFRHGSSSVERGLRARHVDKSRALVHFDRTSKGAGYESWTNWGPFNLLRKRERDCTLRLAQLDRRGLSLIDVGCGGGFFARHARRVGSRVVAIDAVAGMIDAVKPHVDDAFVADIETLRLTDRFDRVICSGVLDFVVDPERAFDNLCRLTADGGLLVVQVPRRGRWGWLYRAEKARWRVRVNLFTKEWFERRAVANGLRMTEIEYPLPHNMVIAFKRDE